MSYSLIMLNSVVFLFSILSACCDSKKLSKGGCACKQPSMARALLAQLKSMNVTKHVLEYATRLCVNPCFAQLHSCEPTCLLLPIS